ncbi:RHS repeat-associated core domain-containing protein, partial [Tenacibaculum sp. FZY0031]|uniref:RHS repeat-associated core domain-containing protein n=1 Tax=Tenacibaculum sp. FZY0031 TaxID=3116648 RepID=UPI002EC0C9F6|nr:RHS repeat-associated core domain-containing protein [Tenacibaculum sp. FZY0031]
QEVDYSYNIRGWLKNINEDGKNDNDLFNFSIEYNHPTDPLKALYNGNIAQTSWNTLNVDSSSKTYTYSYDAMNRLLSATGANTSNYNVPGITYDKNGNIKNLTRNGWQNSATFTNMDVLSYDYGNTNQLNYVTDSGNNNYGFKDGNKSGNDYEYDSNGNMTKDLNKNITSITYNHLNLPIEIKVDNSDSKKINYTYDAMGTKLRKVINDNGNITTLDYANGYTYENNTLEYFPTAEGYVKKDNTGFKYVYQYKDHLGNVRLSYTDNNNDGIITASSDPSTTEIIEESNYYPFGLKHKGYNGNISSIGNSVAQKFGYNGKELEESLGLDLYEMDMRQYDPAIARWTSIDPVIHHSMSTYNAFDNNPVFWADPSGADAVQNENGWTFTGEDAVNVFNAAKEIYGSGPGDGDKKKKKKKSQKKAVKDMGTGELYAMAYNGYARTAYSNGNDPYNPTDADIAQNEREKSEAAFELMMIIDGEWVLARLVQGGRWIYTSLRLGKTTATIARVGKTGKKVVEMGIDKLNALHSVPRAGKGVNYIDDLAELISKNGYDINQAIPVVKMPNGRLVISGGHHRVAAMKKLGENTIPSVMRNWNNLSKAVQQRLLNGPNGEAWKNYLK